ncbi:MCE family protein [Pseudonocardia eucalypti]|uniref:MCE family protein n=1 Tax=Pseudonocardia eucalypti TaxID=648755 RepID=A0ABP9PHJ2_9PSEU|nr:phospholipid/cholesterol/gamma-HCH transport system substrate-binding protein [Pseudonocardia eucalypti]
MRRATRLAGMAVSAAVLAGTLAGCGQLNLSSVPLPGGADLGAQPYEVTVQLRDAMDLVPQAGVKVNNVTVGRVTTVELDPANWRADVHVVLNGDVKLPANSTAELKQTSLLGEKYVELFPPRDAPAQGALAEGAVIPLERTNRFPETEEVLGALSMLLNGGGIGQVQSIAAELNKALGGREGDAKALLHDFNTLTTTLDAQRTDITRALDGLNKLSGNLEGQRGNLDQVLTDLQPGLQVLNEQRDDLVGMLRALDRLSDVAREVVHRSHDDFVADLKALRPTLRELERTGDALPKSLEILGSVPFTDASLAAIKGQHMNLNLILDLNLQDLLNNLGGGLVNLPASAPDLNTLPSLLAPLTGGASGPTAKQPPNPLADLLGGGK